MATGRRTSKKVASDAGKILQDPHASKKAKEVAASALSQRSKSGKGQKK